MPAYFLFTEWYSQFKSNRGNINIQEMMKLLKNKVKYRVIAAWHFRFGNSIKLISNSTILILIVILK